MTKPAFSAEHLSVNYDKTPVLWDINFSVPKGKLIGIVGPNGAGKTTLIKTAMGFLQPIGGKIEFFGQPLCKVRNEVAYVPQRETVDWDFPITVEELVLMGRYGHLGLFRWPRRADKLAVNHYLEMVGMAPYAKRQISQLSGGQQQRVFIARALMQEANLYFMDEPFAGIDHASEGVIMDLLRRMRDQGKTVFVVHHDLGNIESYFDNLVIINMRLIAAGPVSEVFTAENLKRAYGTAYALLGDAVRLSRKKSEGRHV